jgi:DNA-binding NtrC family response regulator
MVDVLHSAISGGDVMGHILLVDDEPAFQRLAGAWLRGLGHTVTVAGSADEAAVRFVESPPDMVLLDLSMPPRMDPMAGIELIGGFVPVPVVVLTGHAGHEMALRSTEAGAWDFIAKPIDPDMLRFVVDRCLRKAALEREMRTLRERAAADDMGLAGRSAAMVRLREIVRRLGPTSVSVLVLGPTGTGKELVARALHACSPRSAGPFVPIHCGALPAELLESELFGNIKGNFSGAHRDQSGLVEAANRGTLFLDEVGEMPPAMQVKLLRFLQDATFLPVGGRVVTKRADVRVIGATHRDLEAMVAEGGFREDLFYRLKGMVLRTPALAERGEDIPQLAALFLRRSAPGLSLAADAVAWLAQRIWPGNVRELRAVVEAAAALVEPGSAVVDAGLLRFVSGDVEEVSATAVGGSLAGVIADVETRLLREALLAAGGNQSEAARVLGVSRVGLIKKMTRLGLR